jgi:hypothetical protein
VYSLRFYTPHTLNRNEKALAGYLWLTDLPMVRFQPDHDFRGVASPSNVCVPVIFCLVWMTPNCCFSCRFFFFSLFSVVKLAFTVYTRRNIDKVVKGWQDIGDHRTIRLRGYYFRLWEQQQHAIRVSVWPVSTFI